MRSAGIALSSGLPETSSTREKTAPVSMGNVGGTLKYWFGSQNETEGQVSLVDAEMSRMTHGLEQKREGATLDERTNKVRVHAVVVAHDKIVIDVGQTFKCDAILVQIRRSSVSAYVRQTRRVNS